MPPSIHVKERLESLRYYTGSAEHAIWSAEPAKSDGVRGNEYSSRYERPYRDVEF